MTEQATRDREILTLKEVETLTGISARTWRYWRAHNIPDKPRSFQLGRAIHYKRADIEQWIEAKYTEGR